MVPREAGRHGTWRRRFSVSRSQHRAQPLFQTPALVVGKPGQGVQEAVDEVLVGLGGGGEGGAVGAGDGAASEFDVDDVPGGENDDVADGAGEGVSVEGKRVGCAAT